MAIESCCVYYNEYENGINYDNRLQLLKNKQYYDMFLFSFPTKKLIYANFISVNRLFCLENK